MLYMIIFKTASDLTDYVQQQKNSGKKLGFVPTMGALHAGHLSLIHQAKSENNITVCSIFINPTQFTNTADFTHYPTTIEKDIEQLIGAGCEVLFLPHQTEIYYEGYQAKHYALGNLETVLEGYYRPGHFQGVCQVVDRLLQIIPADALYLGQKDYQQCMVIKKLLQLTGKEKNVTLTIASTVREESGLAMSSRNMRLNKDQKKAAQTISEVLFYIKQQIQYLPIETLKQTAIERLEAKGFIVDYVAIADGETLEPVNAIQKNSVALVAATIDGIRLIDNLILD